MEPVNRSFAALGQRKEMCVANGIEFGVCKEYTARLGVGVKARLGIFPLELNSFQFKVT
jgi:hypothetical protein